MSLLEIKNLKVEIANDNEKLPIVDDLSLKIDAGETVGLLGESGCGKTVTALSITRLLPAPPVRYTGGQILLAGSDVLKMSEQELRHIRGSVVGYVFQEPAMSLNPAYRVGSQVKDILKLHRPGSATDNEVMRLLKMVEISSPELRAMDYPSQLSGGMQQRVLLAMALAPQPQLLVADEPTTALDVTIQAQILDILRSLRERLGMSILIITHNLGIVSDFADRVAVMYAGQIVELAPTRELLNSPFHPYTQALLNSVPTLGGKAQRLRSIPGNVPDFSRLPTGCRFHPRCGKAKPECSQNVPTLLEVKPGRFVRCPFWSET